VDGVILAQTTKCPGAANIRFLRATFDIGPEDGVRKISLVREEFARLGRLSWPSAVIDTRPLAVRCDGPGGAATIKIVDAHRSGQGQPSFGRGAGGPRVIPRWSKVAGFGRFHPRWQKIPEKANQGSPGINHPRSSRPDAGMAIK